MPTPELSPDTNVFEDFPSVASILAYLHRAGGSAAVSAVLREIVFNRQELTDIVDELNAVGLHKVSALIEPAMEDAPPAPPPWPTRRWLTSYRESVANGLYG